MNYLTNAFSIGMLAHDRAMIVFERVDVEQANDLLGPDFRCAIGHADTARIVGSMLGLHLEPSRESVALGERDGLVIAQYSGPRLPEGATELPEGARIEFWTARHAEGRDCW